MDWGSHPDVYFWERFQRKSDTKKTHASRNPFSFFIQRKTEDLFHQWRLLMEHPRKGGVCRTVMEHRPEGCCAGGLKTGELERRAIHSPFFLRWFELWALGVLLASARMLATQNNWVRGMELRDLWFFWEGFPFLETRGESCTKTGSDSYQVIRKRSFCEEASRLVESAHLWSERLRAKYQAKREEKGVGITPFEFRMKKHNQTRNSTIAKIKMYLVRPLVFVQNRENIWVFGELMHWTPRWIFGRGSGLSFLESTFHKLLKKAEKELL